MQEVSQDEFWRRLMDGVNAHPTIVGDYPYTSVFKLPNGQEWGRIVPTGEPTNYATSPPETPATYYIT